MLSGPARLLVLALVMALAPLSWPAASPALAQSASDTVTAATAVPDYKLGTGDKVRVIVFGEDDLGGEFVVDGNGYIRLPLVGQVKAAGRGVHEFEVDAEAALKQGFLKDPRVSVEVLNYRPFYIIGEVNKPGEYPYVNEMNILNAVALAGGYTFRAKDTYVYIRHANSTDEVAVPADQTTKVQPGDIVRVAERFF